MDSGCCSYFVRCPASSFLSPAEKQPWDVPGIAQPLQLHSGARLLEGAGVVLSWCSLGLGGMEAFSSLWCFLPPPPLFFLFFSLLWKDLCLIKNTHATLTGSLEEIFLATELVRSREILYLWCLCFLMFENYLLPSPCIRGVCVCVLWYG